MKRILFIISISLINLFCFSQNNEITAQLEGLQKSDTLTIEELQEIGLLKTNNTDYSVKSFAIIYSANGFDKEIKSNSNQISKEMIVNLKKCEKEYINIAIIQIVAQDKTGKEIKLNPVRYVIDKE